MPSTTFTASGQMTHAHPGGLLSIEIAGGKGGCLAMYKPTGATRFTTLSDNFGQRVVNQGAVELPAGDVLVNVGEHSGVNANHPIEVSINSF